MRRFFVSSILVLTVLAPAWSDEPLRAPLPPVAPWSGASEKLAAAADDAWLTPGEASGLARSPSYEETMAWLRRLARATPRVQLVDIATSYEGRAVVMAVVSKEGARTPEALRANGRPTVLAQAGIHSGEIDGKDAGMMLLRDLTVGGSLAPLLDEVNLLFVPILNVDGHERASAWSRMNQRGPEVQGWRTNARNLNINRDYVKLDLPETRGVVAVIDDWSPDLYLDLHVTDGEDYQYDITYGWNGPHAYGPRTSGWLDETLRPALDRDLREYGHIPGPLVFAVDRLDIRRGIWNGTTGIRLSNGYGSVRALPTILVENHSLKPFRQRVLGTRVLLESVLRIAAAAKDSLRAAIAADRAARPASVPLDWAYPQGEPRRIPFLGIEAAHELSPITGSVVVQWTGEPWEGEVPVTGDTEPTDFVDRPRAYWIPPAWPDVIDRLRAHGIAFEVIDKPATLDVEMYRVRTPKISPDPFEGRHLVEATFEIEVRRETFVAGSVRVPTDQPLGTLAMLLLEPRSEDSLFSWGFFPEIFQRTEYAEPYALEPLARRMLEADPALKAEFEKRLVEDAAFRGDPGARLRFFYERTPYWDARYLLYPVGRER